MHANVCFSSEFSSLAFVQPADADGPDGNEFHGYLAGQKLGCEPDN